MNICFDSVAVPQSLPECRQIADALESTLADVLPAERFEAMRQQLRAYAELMPQQQEEFRATLGWRRAMFLQDGWLHDRIDAPRPADRAAFAAWTKTQLGPVRKRATRADGMSNSGAASSAATIIGGKKDTAFIRSEADRIYSLDLSGFGTVNYWTHKSLAIDWFPDTTKVDREIVHLAMRYTTFVPLVSGFAVTGDQKYTDMAYRLIADITWQVPGNVMMKWAIRTHWGIDALDVALRSYNMLEIVANGTDGFSDDALMLMWKTLYWCGARGQEFWHTFNHNILFFESGNLAAIGFYFSAFKESKLWRDSAQQRMHRALRGAVLADGCNVEAAPRYHTIYLREPLLTMNASADSGIPLAEGFVETARRQGAKMANYWARVMTPTGTIPSLGDSSAMQCKPQLQTSAEHYGADFALRATSDDPSKWPAETSAYLPAHRLAVMRSGWDSDAIWLCYALRGWHHGHDHRDVAHFELQAGPRQLLLDSGTIDYGANRLRGQETKAHNTLIVDGQNQFDGSAHDIRWYSNDTFDWCEGLNLSYAGILHRRAICYLKPGCFVVLDRVTFNGPATSRKFEIYYHLPHDANLTFDERSVASNDKDQWNIRLDLLSDTGWTLSRTEGFLATGYMKEVPGPIALYAAQRDKGFTVVTLIQPTGPGRAANATAKLAEVRWTNAGEGSVLSGASGVGVTVEHGDEQSTILWTEPGMGEKRVGEYSTDGDLLIAAGGKLFARRASYTRSADVSSFNILLDQSESVPG